MADLCGDTEAAESGGAGFLIETGWSGLGSWCIAACDRLRGGRASGPGDGGL